MSHRKEHREHQKALSKPDAKEATRRNRETRLDQTPKVYTEAPESLEDGSVFFYFDADDLLVARGYKNGKLSEIVGTEVV